MTKIIPIGTVILLAQFCWAKPSTSTEIHVNLLGQSCLMQGPFDEATLKAIHSIGPAQIYPNLSSPESPTNKVQLNKALKQIRGTFGLPSLLDRYREKLGNRFEAQIDFTTGLEATQKEGQSAPLQKVGKKYLRNEDLKTFESLIKKLSTSGKNLAQRKDLIEQLFDLYNDSIEKDPEEEFHRAIKKLNIQYVCSFEESEE